MLLRYSKVARFQPEQRKFTLRLLSYLKVAIFQPELRKCTLRSKVAPELRKFTFVLKSCDFPAGPASVLRAQKLRRSCESLRCVLPSYLKVAIFQPELRKCTSPTTFILKSCEELPWTRGESNPRPRDCESRRANLASTKTARCHSESSSTRTISADGSPRLRRIRTAPQREHVDTHNPHRGFIRAPQKRKKPRVFAPRPRRSPQRVARAPQKRQKKTNKKQQKTSSFCTSTTPILAEGRAGRSEIAKKNRVFVPRPRRAPQRVHPRTAKTQKILEFLHLDHADPRRTSRRNRKKPSFCTSTTPIPAEGPAGTARIAKNFKFLYLNHADPRRGSQTRSTIKVLPRRPRKLNLTYIAAHAEAMHSAPCTWLHALGSMHSMHLAVCTWLYALGSMHSALCARLYVLGSMHGSMHLAPCTWLYVFDSAQVTLCKLVRELRAEEPFGMLSGKTR